MHDRAGGMHDRRDVGLKGCRIGKMQDRREAGQEKCRARGM